MVLKRRIRKYIHGKVVLNRFFGTLSERLPASHGYLSPYSNVWKQFKNKFIFANKKIEVLLKVIRCQFNVSSREFFNSRNSLSRWYLTPCKIYSDKIILKFDYTYTSLKFSKTITFAPKNRVKRWKLKPVQGSKTYIPRLPFKLLSYTERYHRFHKNKNYHGGVLKLGPIKSSNACKFSDFTTNWQTLTKCRMELSFNWIYYSNCGFLPHILS